MSLGTGTIEWVSLSIKHPYPAMSIWWCVECDIPTHMYGLEPILPIHRDRIEVWSEPARRSG